MFYCCFVLFSMRDLRGPWADLREILPHVRKHVQFINVQKFKGLPSPKKFGGEKHAKFGSISDTFPL